MEKEVWLDVIGYEGLYEASNLGKVRRSYSAPHRSLGIPGGLLRPAIQKTGYYTVSLSNEGRVKTYKLSRLVLSAFCGSEPFDGAQAAHNDGNKANNKLTNLRWATSKENHKDVERHNRRCRGENVHGAILTEDKVKQIRSRINLGERNTSISNDFGVSISTIHLIRHGRIWKHVS
jgi:hypothetical protein